MKCHWEECSNEVSEVLTVHNKITNKDEVYKICEPCMHLIVYEFEKRGSKIFKSPNI